MASVCRRAETTRKSAVINIIVQSAKEPLITNGEKERERERERKREREKERERDFNGYV